MVFSLTKIFLLIGSSVSFRLFRFLPLCLSVIFTHLLLSPPSYLRFCVDILFRTFLDFLRYLLSLPFFLFLGVPYLRFCVGILFRTFLDFSISSTPTDFVLFNSLLFSYDSGFLSLFFVSKILRGHTVPHFLRSLSILSSISSILLSTYSLFIIDPCPLRFSFLRFCVDILSRTFLDFLLSLRFLSFFCFLISLCFFFVNLRPLLILSPLRFCVDILFRTFLDSSVCYYYHY